MSSPMADASRISNACLACRKRKVKCSGLQPCQNCQKHNQNCVFEDSVRRKNYPVSYVESLIWKVAELQQKVIQYDPGIGKPTPSGTGVLQQDDSAALGGNFHLGQDGFQHSRDTGSADALLIGSNLLGSSTFASHLNRVLESRRGTHGDESLVENAATPSITGEHLSKFQQKVQQILPSEEDSLSLLYKFHGSISDAYHFVDQRQSADRLASMFHPTSSTKFNDMWYAEILLILALGQLFSGQSNTQTYPPGTIYFLEARDRLPNVEQLLLEPVLGIEIMCLLALYQLCCDKGSDAYVYTGIAVRLAATSGMFEGKEDDKFVQSEKVHQNRLWWTLYTLDRKIASSIGKPYTVLAHEMRIPMPISYPGFPSPEPMIANISLTQIMGDTITTLYNPQKASKETIIAKVQTILNSIRHVAQALPAQNVINFDQPNLRVSRTSASLHLDLFQAIILSIRPVMFHLLRRKIRELRGDIPPPEKCPLDLVRLTGICRDAASKILEVILSMEYDATLHTILTSIVYLGVWDLDALVAASFVFVIDGVISPSLKAQQSAQLNEAHRIICKFAQAGNETATKRARDIDHLMGLSGLPGSVQPTENANVTSNSWSHNQMSDLLQVTASERVDSDQSIRLQTPTTGEPTLSVPFLGTHGFELDSGSIFVGDADFLDIYTDPDFSLTGVNSTDWVELERLMLDFQPDPMHSLV